MSNYYWQFQKIYKKTLRLALLLKVFYFLPNIIVFVLAFYSTFLSSFYLASFSSGKDVAFVVDVLYIFGADGGIYPIYAVTVSAISSAILGFISLFYIKERLLQNRKHVEDLKLEHLKYRVSWGPYSELEAEAKDKHLFEASVVIVEYLKMDKFYE